MNESQTIASDAPSSPEDGGNFRSSLQIDMKTLVGDAVGNVSRLMPKILHRVSKISRRIGLEQYFRTYDQ